MPTLLGASLTRAPGHCDIPPCEPVATVIAEPPLHALNYAFAVGRKRGERSYRFSKRTEDGNQFLSGDGSHFEGNTGASRELAFDVPPALCVEELILRKPLHCLCVICRRDAPAVLESIP